MNYREVIPLKQKPNWQVGLPGSKSITNRVFLCAALAKGKSQIYGALKSDDTTAMLNALLKLETCLLAGKVRNFHRGGQAKFEKYITIQGSGGKFKSGNVTVDAGASGTTTRFLTALSVLRKGKTTIKGTKRMMKRPLDDLNNTLVQLKSGKNVLSIRGDKSSQFLSALLMISPALAEPIRIEVVGKLVSKPYIDTTIAVMKSFGVNVKNDNYKSFIIKPQQYKAGDYYVEGDASAASYWTSIAYLHGGKVKFTNLSKKSVQGDANYAKMLPKLGSVIDMNSMPDVAMTLAVTAPFAKKPTKITGLSTLRLKETDRLGALENELKKVGVKVKVTKDSITIKAPVGAPWVLQSGIIMRHQRSPNGAPTGITIGTYNDHRMAMCFAVLGTKVPGIVIEDPDCVNKTYPNFWKDLELAYLFPIKLGKKNLILTGMRCSGKTYLGKKIAKHLNRKFIDLDIEIEKQVTALRDPDYGKNMKIKDIVKRYGWPYFRKVESTVAKAMADQTSEPLVIATGGGVVLSPKNMRNLKKNGVNVFIFADTSTIIERIKKQSKNRPTLTGKGTAEEIKDVWRERRDLYLKYADYVWDNTSGEVLKENLNQIFI